MDPKHAFQDRAGPPAVKKAADKLRRAAEELAAAVAAQTPPSGDDLGRIMSDIETARKKSAEAEEALLPHQMEYNLGLVRGWVADLGDPEYAAAGADFERLCAQDGFAITLDAKLDCTALYSSYSLKRDNPGFINTIYFGRRAAMEPFRLFNAYVHETLHGLQKKSCPALLASPFNEGTATIRKTGPDGNSRNEDVSIVICPDDWLLLQERCEQDAYAKQGWLNTLLGGRMPGALAAGSKDAISAADFALCRAQAGGSLAGGLRRAAAMATAKKFYIKSDGTPADDPYSFAHNWQDIALKGYADAMDIRRDRGQRNIVFVRIGPEDVHDIGRSFGPNPFGTDPHDPALLRGTAPLTAWQGTPHTSSTAARLRELNDALGIADKNQLPTLREYLAAHNITPEQFSRNATRRPPSAQTVPTLNP